MNKFNEGDLVEFIPGNYIFHGYNTSHWLEGTGIIYAVEDGYYNILVFCLRKISTKNFSEYEVGETRMRLPVKECDEAKCFKILEAY
jgi:hypothetical protein